MVANKARIAMLRLKIFNDLESIPHLIRYADTSASARNAIAGPHVFQGLSIGLCLMFWTEGSSWSLMIKTLSLLHSIKVASCTNRLESVIVERLTRN